MNADREKFFQSKACRVIAAVSLPTLLVSGIIFFLRMRHSLFCPLRELTGIYCPGCGAGRASLALLRLDILTALKLNPLYVLSLPAAAWLGGGRWLNYVTGRRIIPQPRIPKAVWYAVCVITAAFWILRNIPAYPFTLLAPP